MPAAEQAKLNAFLAAPARATSDKDALVAEYTQTVTDISDLSIMASKNFSQNQQNFYFWSVGGLAIGLGGAISNASTSPARRKARYAQYTSALAGLTSGIVGLFHFETHAQQFLGCANALNQLLLKFKEDWGNPANFLNGAGAVDAQKAKDFEQDRINLLKTDECKTVYGYLFVPPGT